MKKSLLVFGMIFLLLITLAHASLLEYYGKITAILQVTTNPNIVGWWRFEEAFGQITQDVSLYNNHGILGNDTEVRDHDPNWSTICKFGSCLEFDGNDYVQISHSSSLNVSGNEITLEAWIYPYSLPASGERWQIIGKTDAYALQIADGGKVRVWLGPLTTYIQTDEVVLQTNNWHYITATYDGRKVKIYVDGEIKKEVPKSGNQATSSTNVIIGARIPGGYFIGKIDEPRVWKIALTSEQIKSIYERGVGG